MTVRSLSIAHARCECDVHSTVCLGYSELLMLFCTLGTRSNLAFKSEHQGSKLKIANPQL